MKECVIQEVMLVMLLVHGVMLVHQLLIQVLVLLCIHSHAYALYGRMSVQVLTDA